MLRTKQFNLKLIYGLEQWTVEEIAERLSAQFEDSKGFGFIDTHFDETSVFSNLVYKTITKQTIFDPTLNNFISQEQVLFYSIPFEIDLKAKLLEGETSGRKLTKLVTVLANLFDFDISVEDLYVDFKKLFKVLDRTNTDYSIVNITIENYRPEVGLSGRFIASIQDQTSAYNLIREYSLDIRNVDLLLNYNFSEMVWRLSSLGSIAIRAEEDEISEGTSFLKEIMIEANNA